MVKIICECPHCSANVNCISMENPCTKSIAPGVTATTYGGPLLMKCDRCGASWAEDIDGPIHAPMVDIGYNQRLLK